MPYLFYVHETPFLRDVTQQAGSKRKADVRVVATLGEE